MIFLTLRYFSNITSKLFFFFSQVTLPPSSELATSFFHAVDAASADSPNEVTKGEMIINFHGNYDLDG